MQAMYLMIDLLLQVLELQYNVQIQRFASHYQLLSGSATNDGDLLMSCLSISARPTATQPVVQLLTFSLRQSDMFKYKL